MWEDEAGELLMSLRGEQGELRELTSEQDEQYYYIDRMNPLKKFIMFNF